MKKKYYLTLDTETATLPFADELCANAKQKQAVAISKPLVYDIGWCISDRQGNIVKKENFLVQETFFVPNIFNTAYYKDKRPIYINLLQKGGVTAKNWNDIIQILLADLRTVDIATAYNATFDYKKAIPFTESYIYHLYHTDFNEWEKQQRKQCENIVSGKTKQGTRPDFLDPVFELRGEQFPIADLWGIACERLINGVRYKEFCFKNKYLTNSAQYFDTSAETAFQYLMQQYDFIEEHTALSDAEIETAILTKALKRGKVSPQIESFPFKKLGTTYNYVVEGKRKYIDVLIELLKEYIDTSETKNNSYWKKIENILSDLEYLQEKSIVASTRQKGENQLEKTIPESKFVQQVKALL